MHLHLQVISLIYSEQRKIAAVKKQDCITSSKMGIDLTPTRKKNARTKITHSKVDTQRSTDSIDSIRFISILAFLVPTKEAFPCVVPSGCPPAVLKPSGAVYQCISLLYLYSSQEQDRMKATNTQLHHEINANQCFVVQYNNSMPTANIGNRRKSDT
jgi:hypothetical protein